MRKILLYFICLCCSTLATAQPISKIKVNGKIQSYNGVSDMPIGLFGVHRGNFNQFNATLAADWGIEAVRSIQTIPTGNTFNAPAVIKQVVDCWFDRFQPARNVENPLNWRNEFYQRATQYVNNTSGLNREVILEFWNEPYLNWAYKPGVNTDPQFYDTTGRTVGGAVRLKGKTTPEPYLVWKNDQWYASNFWNSNRQGIYGAISSAWNTQLVAKNIPYPGLTGALEAGEEYFVGTNRHFTVIDALRPVDTTQHSFYSARQNSVFYNEMYGVLADTVRKLNPNLILAAGWGFTPHEDNWYPWNTLFKPLIDEYYDKIDAIHEHHYAMDTRIIAADYETMYAYAYTKYGRKYKFINTETGGFLDPQRPNNAANNAGTTSLKQRALNAFVYNTKDILYLIAHSPDKAYSRAIHEPQNTNGGVAHALRNLKKLRGRLLYANTDDANIWSVATLNGDSLLTLACFNHHNNARQVELNINAPSGFQFNGATWQSIDTLPNADTLFMNVNNIVATGTNWIGNVTIPPLQVRVWHFRLTGNATSIDTVKVQQLFADTVLMRVPANVTADFTIDVPTTQLAQAQGARLKFMMQNNSGNATVQVNGTPITFNYQGDSTLKHRGGISYAVLPISLIAAQNTISITPNGESADVWFVSLELTTDSVLPLSIAKRTEIQHLSVFPNPFQQQITLSWTGATTDNLQFVLLDATGKVQHSTTISTQVGKQEMPLNLPNQLAKGIYFYRLSGTSGKYATGKLIKE